MRYCSFSTNHEQPAAMDLARLVSAVVCSHWLEKRYVAIHDDDHDHHQHAEHKLARFPLRIKSLLLLLLMTD